MLLQIRRWQGCLPPLRTPRKDGAPPVGTVPTKNGREPGAAGLLSVYAPADSVPAGCLPPFRTPRKDGAPPVGTAQRKKGKVRHLPVLSPPKADSSTRPRCAIAAAGGSERQIVWGLGASYSVRPGAAQVSWRTRVSAPHGPRHRRYPTHLGDTRLAPC